MKNNLARFFVGFSWLAVLATLAAVILLVGFLLYRSGHILNIRLFFGETPLWPAIIAGTPVLDGIWPACVGTFYLISLSSLIALPLGISSGIYLAQYAAGRPKRLISLGVEVLAGVPSIIMGLFGFALILFLRQTLLAAANTGLLLAAGCITLLILPYLILTTQTSLEGVPDSLKLAGVGLGLTPWQNIRAILLPAASRGILSGVILSVGRAAEDTAVILLTGVVANAGLPRHLTDKFEALPFNIYYLAAEHRTQTDLDRGFGSALVLLALTSALFLGAHLLHRTITRHGNTT
ncbi:PstA family ABC transporter permease [Desulfobacca acetoxidans]|nr:phosphate ABC transporter permease [Desulfobacterales bacterium]